ncbi:MAG TPA: right-handed parallel beta-helix repeat-containing protein [Opitutus sp.]|nr:right-handed parallel beta-helix repeat-containing protein [Opitutus sp.]
MKTRHSIRPLAILLLTLAAARLDATTVFWVSPDGHDDAAGTQEQPFATLARAKAAVRDELRKGATEDVAVRMRGGVYSPGETLELTGDDLGDGRTDVTFMAQPGERVILSGARALAGTWQRVRDNLWKLAVPEARDGKWVFRSLFRGEDTLQRAREPDRGYFTVSAVENDRRRLKLQQKLPAAWHDLTGVEVNTTAFWHFNRQPVAEITEDSILGQRPIGTDVSSAQISGKSHSRVWLENALAFADEPGEWFLDSAKGELYYVAAAAEDPNTERFRAPVLRELIVVRGSAEKLVRRLHFRGLEFAETDWELPPEGRLGVQAGAWALDRSRTFSPGAALRFIYASETSVQDCRFHNLGDGAIAFEIGTRDGLVSRCDFREVGSDAIQVGRMPAYTGVGHPLHRDFATAESLVEANKSLPGAEEIWARRSQLVPEAPSHITLADNTLVDCGNLDYGSVAICVTYAHHIVIEHNLISDLPYSAINVGWRWAPGFTNCHSNLVRGNRIEHIMQQAGDGGGVYLMGEQPGTRVLDNYVNDSGRNYWSHGLYTDECADHMEIARNYVTGVMDHSIFMNKNGPNQDLHDNNGEPGVTAITGSSARGGQWVDFRPARVPPDLSLYGPRTSRP